MKLHKTLLASLCLAFVTGDGMAALFKTDYGESPITPYMFVDNREDNNMFVAPTKDLNPRLTGANAWTHRPGPGGGQTSLAYADNGYNNAVTGWYVDMWEKGPIVGPYSNQRCLWGLANCDTSVSEPFDKPAVVDNEGFYGLMRPAEGWAHGKLSPSFFNYLRNEPLGSVLTRVMNTCATNVYYNAAAGERCVDVQHTLGTTYWFVSKVRHKKVAHLTFSRTDALSEVMVDSNGSPIVIPGSQGCENYISAGVSGLLCRFLDYDLQIGDTTLPTLTMYVNITDARLNSATTITDLKMTTDMTAWTNRDARLGLINLKHKKSIYLFMSDNFFKQLVRLGLTDKLTRDLIKFNFFNALAPESGYYDFNGTTELIVKPRQHSVSILSSDGVANPYREGKVGSDILRFPYNIADSGPSSASALEVRVTQNDGKPYQGYCTFYPTGKINDDMAVPVPTKLVFNSALHGTHYQHPIRCDNTAVDIRELGIKDSQPQIDWNDPVNGRGVTRFYTLNLEFDLRDPIVRQTIRDEPWEGTAHQSGTISVKGIWR